MYKILFWIFFALLIVLDVYIYKKLNYKLSDTINLFIVSATTLTALVAFYQLKANHEWNRRHSAMVEAEKSRDKYVKAVKELNKSLNYREQEDSYSLKEIHRYLCDNEKHTENPPITDNGKKIKHNIFVILNYYEYLAVGIKNQVFDEKTIRELIKGSLIKSNTLFGEYIKHLREKHTKNKNQFIEMENLAIKWQKKPWYDVEFKRGTSD